MTFQKLSSRNEAFKDLKTIFNKMEQFEYDHFFHFNPKQQKKWLKASQIMENLIEEMYEDVYQKGKYH